MKVLSKEVALAICLLFSVDYPKMPVFFYLHHLYFPQGSILLPVFIYTKTYRHTPLTLLSC